MKKLKLPKPNRYGRNRSFLAFVKRALGLVLLVLEIVRQIIDLTK